MADPVTLYHYKNGNLHTHNGVAASLHEGCQLVGEFIPVEESIIQELSRVRDQRDEARGRHEAAAAEAETWGRQLDVLDKRIRELIDRWDSRTYDSEELNAVRAFFLTDLEALLEGENDG